MNYTSLVLSGLALSGVCFAGDEIVSEKGGLYSEPASSGWSYCSLLDTFGKPIYDDPQNPLFQSLKFSGRAQLQYAYVDGEDVNGDDFSEDFEEIRRLRLGGELKMLKYFKLKGEANLAADAKPSGGDRDLGYQSLDALILSFDAGKAFGIETFDKVIVNYGRHKVAMGQEVHTSSKYIKTVERSAVANKVYPTRATGVSVNLAKGNWSGAAGVFSTDASKEIASWDDGQAYYLSSTFKRENGDQVILDFLYNDANGSASDNELKNNLGDGLYEWAASAAYVAKRDRLQVVVNGTYGDNGDQFIKADANGAFWGLVIMPSYWLVPDRWEAVARYSYQGSEGDEGIRMNSRYARRNHGGKDSINSGRGDEHHSIYAGLNYYLCGEKSKIMTGIEYETLDTSSGDVDASTLWLAYRTYF